MTTPDSAFDRAAGRAEPSLILDVSTRAVFHAAVVFAIWLLAAGHNRPGGGFVGGLTISAALVLAYVGGGSRGLRQVLPLRPVTFLGVGMLVVQAAAVVPLLLGGSVLESAVLTVHLPLFGEVKLVTPLVFDTGVLLIVIGLVAKALDTLGAVDPGDAPVAEADDIALGRARPSGSDPGTDDGGEAPR